MKKCSGPLALTKLRKFLLLMVLCCGSYAASQAQIINTMAGSGSAGYTGDGGPATAATLNSPWGIILDPTNSYLYISDFGNSVVRVVDLSTGIINTFAGTGTPGYSGDGGAATAATLSGPTGIACDPAGNVYIADNGNLCIRKVTISTGIISTVAGSGSWGYTGDGGPATAATMTNPNGVAVDAAGNIYIPDQSNYVIRKVNGSTGVITTVAGSGSSGYTGDGGPATAATMALANDVSVDAAGNLYISDWFNYCIRKVDAATGLISTYAGDGTGTPGYAGDGGPATAALFNSPMGVDFRTGDVVFCDVDNYVLRKVNPIGTVSTIAGLGTAGYSGDGGAPLSAEFDRPVKLIYDAAGNMYISDRNNNAIRIITPGAPKCYDDIVLNVTDSTDTSGNCVFIATATIASGRTVLGYSWNDGSGSTMHTTHAYSDVHTFTLSPSGSATVCVTVYLVDMTLSDPKNGPCCQAMKCAEVSCPGPRPAGTADDHLKAANNISVYPNPTDNVVTITSTQADIRTVQVVDATGKKIADHTFNSERSASIPLAKMPPGIYLLKVNGTVTKTVTKVK